MTLRIYLTGQLLIEAGPKAVGERDLPARQGRRAFAYLACERGQLVSRDELAEAIWGEGLPSSWEAALHALVSKLRRVTSGTGIGVSRISSAYQLRLPYDLWIDIEVAMSAIDEAEALCRSDDPRKAWGSANVAAAISGRPFLAGEEGAWVDRQRSRLHNVRTRAMECLAQVSLSNHEPNLAVQFATEASLLDPYRETALRLLMRAYVLLGSRAKALKAYEDTRSRLEEELGADPSPETEALYLEIIRGQ